MTNQTQNIKDIKIIISINSLPIEQFSSLVIQKLDPILKELKPKSRVRLYSYFLKPSTNSEKKVNLSENDTFKTFGAMLTQLNTTVKNITSRGTQIKERSLLKNIVRFANSIEKKMMSYSKNLGDTVYDYDSIIVNCCQKLE